MSLVRRLWIVANPEFFDKHLPATAYPGGAISADATNRSLSPRMDLLLENLILEPGRTVNSTSFLPYRLFVSTQNDLEIRNAHSKKTVSKTKSTMTIPINGLSVAAQDLGFWIRGHAGLVRFADQGIASFFLDERGIDISLALEIGREKLEQILTQKAVRVLIHNFDYIVILTKAVSRTQRLIART